MPIAPDPGRAAHDRFALALRIALAAAIAVTFVVHAIYGPDWELLVSKHYWSRGFYYGGYAMQVVDVPAAYRTIQVEGLANVTNLLPLTYTEAENPSSPYFTGFPGTERLLAPFAVSAIVHFTGTPVLTAFWLVNIAAWLIAIGAAYRIAQLFFSDRYSPVLMAIVVAVYPIFTLTFNGVKVPHLGTSYLLIGIYAYEKMQRYQPVWLHPIGVGSLMLAGMFASGGWAMLGLYIVMRQAWTHGHRRWVNLAILLIAVGLARYVVGALTTAYNLPSVEKYLRIDYPAVLAETGQWLSVWSRGGDISELKFVNLPGRSVYAAFLPTITKAFLAGHFWAVVIALVACWYVAAARMFMLMAVPMFFLGHSATALTGWAEWHYGYLSSPAAMLVFLSMCGGLGALAARRELPGKLVTALLLGAIVWGFADHKRHAGLFWGGNPQSYEQRVIVHYEGLDREFVY